MPVGPSSFAAWPSLLSSLGYQSLILVSPHLLQPGRPLLGSLGYQSLVLVSTHLLQPGRPLLGSLRCQSPTTGSAHLLQCTLPPLRTLCSASSSVPLSPLPQSVSSAVSPARRVLSRSLLRRSLSYLFCEDPGVPRSCSIHARSKPAIHLHVHVAYRSAQGYWPARAAAHDIHIRGAPPRVTNLDPRGLFDVR